MDINEARELASGALDELALAWSVLPNPDIEVVWPEDDNLNTYERQLIAWVLVHCKDAIVKAFNELDDIQHNNGQLELLPKEYRG